MSDYPASGRWLSTTIVVLFLVQILFSLSAANYFRNKAKRLASKLEAVLVSQQARGPLATADIASSDESREDQKALAERVASIRTRFALFDVVGVHHKNGLTEVYGGTLRPRHAGPLRLSATEFLVTHDRALVLYRPDYSRASGATHVAVRMERKQANGKLTVGIMTGDSRTFLFTHRFGPNAPAPPQSPLPPLVPQQTWDQIDNAKGVIPLVETSADALYGPLPAELATRLDDPEVGLTAFFVSIDGAGGHTVSFEHVALVELDNHRAAPDTVSVSGMVTGALLPPGAEVELRLETGEVRRQLLAADDSFRFDAVTTNVPVSLRFRREKRWFYGVLGRWFAVDHSRNDVDIVLAPLFSNPTGKAADVSTAKFVTPREPTKVAALYESHAHQYWPGGGNPKEYDSLTFTNNMGFIDRDRTFDNPDGCLRVVHLGSSHAVALQVRPFEKYNIEMESELSVMTQRCVEVLSAGRDNGDIGSNYPRVRDYAINFSPDVILLENSSHLVMQLQPQLLKQAFGWDHEFNALDNFYYDENGELSFREWSPDYGLYAVAPELEELIPGVPMFDTLRIPLAAMHPKGREAFKYFGDVLALFETRHPDQRFVVHTGLDQAQCRSCEREVTMPNGELVAMGAGTFVMNHDEVCARYDIRCINPEGAETFIASDHPLTFFNDGHYSLRGHQWLAQELSNKLIPILCGAGSLTSASEGVCAAGTAP